MNYELVYTSAPKGLKPGASGFCTVAATEGIPSPLIDRLELLSGFQPLHNSVSNGAATSPVSIAHWRVRAGGRTRSVLSRVAAMGLDYTRRPNKLAYHLVLDPGAHPEAGPAWALSRPGLMLENWTGPSKTLPPRSLTALADFAEPVSQCEKWATATGDAGWAGILGESFMIDPLKPIYLIRGVETDPLPFLDEAVRLMPPQFRWQVTFNTYFSELPAGLNCAVRCVIAETPVAEGVARSGALIVNLTRSGGRAPDTPGAAAAREGRPIPVPPPGSTLAQVSQSSSRQN